MWGRWRERKAEREAKQLAFLKQHAELKEAEAKRKPIDEVLDRHARQVKRSDYEGGLTLAHLEDLELRQPFVVRFVGSEPPRKRPHEPTPEDAHGLMLCYLYYEVICYHNERDFDSCFCTDYDLDEVVVRSLPHPELDDIYDPNVRPFLFCPECGRSCMDEFDFFSPVDEPVYGWQCRNCGYRHVRLLFSDKSVNIHGDK